MTLEFFLQMKYFLFKGTTRKVNRVKWAKEMRQFLQTLWALGCSQFKMWRVKHVVLLYAKVICRKPKSYTYVVFYKNIINTES